MHESFISKFIRTAIRANFKPNDEVPILRTPIANIFGSTVKELNEMSRIERVFEYAWYAFAGFITGFMVLVGLVLLARPSELLNFGWMAIALGLIWLFCLIQFLSLVGYVRYKLRKKR